jgi:hypothetical protein
MYVLNQQLDISYKLRMGKRTSKIETFAQTNSINSKWHFKSKQWIGALLPSDLKDQREEEE